MRPVDWRWQRAGELVANPDERLIRGSDDTYVSIARRFRRQVDRVRTSSDQTRLQAMFPELFEAWALVTVENSPMRYELEARILADEPFESIATKLPVGVETIKFFEALYFNVLDRLTMRGYITHQVFSKSIQCGLQERDFDCLWKMYGYWGGPTVLDALIYRFNAPGRPTTGEGVRAFWQHDFNESIPMKAAISARIMPINWDTYAPLMETYMQMQSAERDMMTRGSQTDIVGMMSELVQSMSWRKTAMGCVTIESDSEVADASAAKLRASELAFIGRHGVPDSMRLLLDTAVFPEHEVKHGAVAAGAGD